MPHAPYTAESATHAWPEVVYLYLSKHCELKESSTYCRCVYFGLQARFSFEEFTRRSAQDRQWLREDAYGKTVHSQCSAYEAAFFKWRDWMRAHGKLNVPDPEQ